MTRAELRAACPSNDTGGYIEWLKSRVLALTADEEPRKAAERIVQSHLDNAELTDDDLRNQITTAIQAASNAQLERGRASDICQYNERQRQWSRKTFGDGKRTRGIITHIRKELEEIVDQPNDLEEWIDVAILALDGYWRHGGEPAQLMAHLQAKQNKNFARRWPAPEPEDEPVEHVRDIAGSLKEQGWQE